MLSAAIRDAGAVVSSASVVPDDVRKFLDVIERSEGTDLVLTSGGISAGRYEVVKQALAPHGIEFTPVAMRPGRPQGAGEYRGVPVITLPGNPVSAWISFEVFVRPALRAAMGLSPASRPVTTGKLKNPVESRPGIHHYRLGTHTPAGILTVMSSHESHLLSMAARATRLIELTPDIAYLPAGAYCSAWSLE
jgi:molybdopterin molybdotransferase